MIVIIGLVILIAAVLTRVAGIFANSGRTHSSGGPTTSSDTGSTDAAADEPGNDAGQGRDNRTAFRERSMRRLFDEISDGPAPAGTPRGDHRR